MSNLPPCIRRCRLGDRRGNDVAPLSDGPAHANPSARTARRLRRPTRRIRPRPGRIGCSGTTIPTLVVGSAEVPHGTIGEGETGPLVLLRLIEPRIETKG